MTAPRPRPQPPPAPSPSGHVTLTVLLLLCLMVGGSPSGSGGAVDVLPSRFGSFNFDELEHLKYNMEISSRPVSEADTSNSEPSRLTLVSRHGQRYSCDLPHPHEVRPDGEADEIDAKQLPNVSSLLLALGQGSCLRKTIGWWTYEYCHGDVIKQYHLEAGKIKGKTVFLGHYNNETVWDQDQVTRVKGIIKSLKKQLLDGQPVASHSAFYDGGTTCDVTGKLRAATAKLFCAITGKDDIVDVEERETCNYTLNIQTPLLCTHPLFRPKSKDKAHTLNCSPMVSQEDYEEYLRQHEPRSKQAQQPPSLVPELAAHSETIDQENVEKEDMELYYRWRLIKSLTKLIEFTDDLGSDSSDEFSRRESEKDGQEVETEASATADASGDAASPKKEETVGSISEKQQRSAKQQTRERESEFEGRDDMEYLATLLSKAVDKTAVALQRIAKQEAEERAPEERSHSLPRSMTDLFSGKDESASSSSPATSDNTHSSQETFQYVDRTQQQEGGDATGAHSLEASGDQDLLEEEEESSDRDNSSPLLGMPSNANKVVWRKGPLKSSEGEQNEVEDSDSTVNEEEEVEKEDEEETKTAVVTEEEEVEEEDVEEEEQEDSILMRMAEKMEGALQDELDRAGLDTQATVKVKFLTMGTADDEEEAEEEEEQRVTDVDEDGQVTLDGGTGKEKVGPLKVMVMGEDKLPTDFLSKLLNDLYYGDSVVSEERRRQMSLESSYEQVWGDEQDEREQKQDSKS